VGAIIFWILAVVVSIGTWAIVTHNNIVNEKNLVAESWRQIDVELRRRHDLIPNLVRVVEAHTQYEHRMLELLAEARASAMAKRALPERAEAEVGLDQAVSTVLVQAESYPALQSDRQFLALQRELVETDNRLAAARRIYNSNVRALNESLGTLPGRPIGSLTGAQPAQYFELPH